MKILAFDIPEHHDDQVARLENHLTGICLPDLVMELEAVHQPKDHVALQDVLSHTLPDVLANGISRTSPAMLQGLLTNPRVLFELQEQILTNGGPYWTAQVAISSDAGTIADQNWQAIRHSISATTTAPPSVAKQPRSPVAWFRQPLFVSITTAAVVLAAVFLPRQFDSTPQDTVASTGWGWDRPGALDENLPADQYMARLASSADEWFRKRPQSPAEVAVRIADFRKGCSTLILASHQPLADHDRQWLVDKCKAWAAKLDAHLTAVEDGESPEAVRNAADETISNLRDALQKRSKEISERTV